MNLTVTEAHDNLEMIGYAPWGFWVKPGSFESGESELPKIKLDKFRSTGPEISRLSNADPSDGFPIPVMRIQSLGREGTRISIHCGNVPLPAAYTVQLTKDMKVWHNVGFINFGRPDDAFNISIPDTGHSNVYFLRLAEPDEIHVASKDGTE